MRFEILPAEYNDLDPSDPMRPATIVHALGVSAQDCYDAIGGQHSIGTQDNRGRAFFPKM